MIACNGLVKIYRRAGIEVFSLQGLDLQVARAEMVAIVGNSGSGKSTLMNIVGGLDAPSAGSAHVGDWDLTKLTAKQRDTYRRQVTGFVWQNSGLNLIPYLTPLDNVLLAMRLRGKPSRQQALDLLDLVGIGDKYRARTPSLSGGEQQRAAVAVALAHRPPLLLADEPTGSLDAVTARSVIDVFRRINAETGTTIVLVTHDPAVAAQVPRTVRIRDGKVAGEASGGGEEKIVLDSAGRLQIPRHLLAAAGIASQVDVTVRGSEVVISRPELAATPPPPDSEQPR